MDNTTNTIITESMPATQFALDPKAPHSLVSIFSLHMHLLGIFDSVNSKKNHSFFKTL